jgi:hypothetical protein
MGLCEPRPEDLDKLWRERVILANEIVDVVAPTIDEAIFKVTMTTSLLSGGEVQVALTPQCLGLRSRAVRRQRRRAIRQSP